MIGRPYRGAPPRPAGLLLLVLAVLLCHGVLGAAHQSSFHQESPVRVQVFESGQPHAGGHGAEPGSVEHGLGGSYYAAALIMLGLSGLVTAMALGRVLILSRRAGTFPAARWSVRPRLRPPPAPTGAYLQVFRL